MRILSGMTTSTARLAGPLLNPRVTVLVRPSGVVQLGWDPERAMLLDPPGIDTSAVLGFLRLLDGRHGRAEICARASEHGLAPEQAEQLLDEIDAAGLLQPPREPSYRITAVRVHGAGPLSDAVASGLRGLGVRPRRSHTYRPESPRPRERVDLVVLTDTVVVDPRLVADLVVNRVPHLQVRLRDGKGVIGPFVLPGETSCLRCADLIKADYDADWPHLAAQLLDRVGHASPAAVAATAALALTELEAILECSTHRCPATLNTTLELDLDSHQLQHRRWEPHPRCGCRRLRAAPA